jgi:hypothetical protein
MTPRSRKRRPRSASATVDPLDQHVLIDLRLDGDSTPLWVPRFSTSAHIIAIAKRDADQNYLLVNGLKADYDLHLKPGDIVEIRRRRPGGGRSRRSSSDERNDLQALRSAYDDTMV